MLPTSVKNILAEPVLTDPRKLREHEGVSPSYLEKIKNQILKDGVLKYPIVVDRSTRIILDGHHRFHALIQLGCSRIPVSFVDYSSPCILVASWGGEPITKEQVIRAGLSGKKLPPKTSRHMLNSPRIHISRMARRVNAPLDKLKEGD